MSLSCTPPAEVRPTSHGLEHGDEWQPGTKDYAEGWGPAVEWNDRAKVDQVGISNCVPTGCHDDVVVIAEFNPDEPGKTQIRYYAPGVGGIRTDWRGKNEKDREELELTTVATLSDAGLASVGKALLAEEKRAYSRRPEVWADRAHEEGLS